MLDLIFIILIFLEIALLYLAIVKIIELDKKIQKLSAEMLEKGKIINEMHLKIQKTAHNINFFLSILTSKKLWQIKKIISTVLSVIELYIILKSFNFQKGVKFNLKNARKLLFTGLSRQIIKKLFNSIALACR